MPRQAPLNSTQVQMDQMRCLADDPNNFGSGHDGCSSLVVDFEVSVWVRKYTEDDPFSASL